jgi:hypothetical protein
MPAKRPRAHVAHVEFAEAGGSGDAAEHVDEAETVDSDVVAADQSAELEDSEPERPTYCRLRSQCRSRSGIPSPPGAIRRRIAALLTRC